VIEVNRGEGPPPDLQARACAWDDLQLWKKSVPSFGKNAMQFASWASERREAKEESKKSLERSSYRADASTRVRGGQRERGRKNVEARVGIDRGKMRW
jgi:hypothetical protein